MGSVKTAVIPVAGLGTRFLPATKSMPKEMLTIVDRPVVQYAVDEALEAGIEHFIFVTGRNKHVIEDYFDIQPELMATLDSTGKTDRLAILENLQLQPGTVSFTRQQVPKGLGHAIWCARNLIGNEPFAVLLPDMVSFGRQGCLAGVVDLYRECGGNVLAVERCDPDETHKYGIVGKGESVGAGFKVTGMIEKPAPAMAPSNYYISGRYVLQPEVLDILADQEPGAGNEIQLTDAMRRLSEVQDFFACPFKGRMYDCGSMAEFVEANVAFALSRQDLSDRILPQIAKLMTAKEVRGDAA